MTRAAYRDRLLWIDVRLVVYRWRWVPLMGVLSIGKLDPERPPWRVVAAMIAFEVLSIWAGLHHWQLAKPLVYPPWTIW